MKMFELSTVLRVEFNAKSKNKKSQLVPPIPSQHFSYLTHSLLVHTFGYYILQPTHISSTIKQIHNNIKQQKP